MEDPTFTIELRPHKGIKNSPLGPIEITHPQWIVLAGRDPDQPKQIGYLGTHDGARLCWLSGLEKQCGEWLSQKITEAVYAERDRLKQIES